MDWKYKHFDHEAVFNAAPESVHEAARAVVSASLDAVEDRTDGFVARGYSGWRPAIATFHITPAPNGTRVTVELLVERATSLGYMLFDVGSYYNVQVDEWFSGIAQRLGDKPEQVLVSKTTPDIKVLRGCFAGLLVLFIVGVSLGIIASLLDRVLFPQTSGLISIPVSVAASILSLLAGVLAFRYFRYPDAPTSRFIRGRIQRSPDKER